MTRREFLKNLGKFLIALFALHLGKVLSLFFREKKENNNSHHARFYRQADDLAG